MQKNVEMKMKESEFLIFEKKRLELAEKTFGRGGGEEKTRGQATDERGGQNAQKD